MAWSQPVAPASLRRLPGFLKRALSALYWARYDLIDLSAEIIGRIPSHALRLLLLRHALHISIGPGSSVHRGCRFYWPSGVRIGAHTVVNREVLLDGRGLLQIGDNVSISEGSMLLTLEHDLDSPGFATRGAPIRIGNRVFVGTRAIVLPGVSLGEGACVGAGAVVTRDVPEYTIAAGVPARVIGKRERFLSYTLHYRKFLG